MSLSCRFVVFMGCNFNLLNYTIAITITNSITSVLVFGTTYYVATTVVVVVVLRTTLSTTLYLLCTSTFMYFRNSNSNK